jgi:hypothetical protein
VDLNGHLMDRSLRDTAARVSETFGGTSGASGPDSGSNGNEGKGAAGL